MPARAARYAARCRARLFSIAACFYARAILCYARLRRVDGVRAMRRV